MKAEILAENIVKGSGGHGLKKDQLVKIVKKQAKVLMSAGSDGK